MVHVARWSVLNMRDDLRMTHGKFEVTGRPQDERGAQSFDDCGPRRNKSLLAGRRPETDSPCVVPKPPHGVLYMNRESRLRAMASSSTAYGQTSATQNEIAKLCLHLVGRCLMG